MMARKVGSHTRERRVPRARNRAWQSMRILRRFTLGDLIATAEIERDNIQRYLLALEQAGYVRRVADRRSGHRGGSVVYALARDTGPHAPTLHQGQIRDLNLPAGETLHVD